VSPVLFWNYAPAATIPADYAQAVAGPGQPLNLQSSATQTLGLNLSQNFEAKERAASEDSAAAAQAKKFRVLGISTSAITYDLEQARKPGRTGWTMQTMTNSFQSDLLPGFSFALTHDLWDGPVGFDTTEFDLFLSNMSASFGLSANTFRSIGGLFGLGGDTKAPRAGAGRDSVPPSSVSGLTGGMQQRSLRATNQLQGAARSFTANINVNVSRSRPQPDQPAPPANSNISFSTSFSPTRFWGVSLSTQYNATQGTFESQVLRLERDLHDWRAGFNFVKNPNGNFAFYFTIHLVALPDLKADYNQRTLQPR
jgi:hypothetical protein